MPRKARRESATGIYHVMVRGLNKTPVFKEDREKKRIVVLIGENLPLFEVVIYAYCIMPNHFHLLIKAELKELASFMAKVLAAYAQYYNYKHAREGYVFQDRFKSECVEEESYFWNCLRYIHRNPFKNTGVKSLSNYEYSSLGEFYGKKGNIIQGEAAAMVEGRFPSQYEFLEFHKKGNRDVFDDIEEDNAWNNLRIAKEILSDMQWQMGISQEEILEYVDTRRKLEETLKTVLKISNKKAHEIEQIIRNEKKGQGK